MSFFHGPQVFNTPHGEPQWPAKTSHLPGADENLESLMAAKPKNPPTGCRKIPRLSTVDSPPLQFACIQLLQVRPLVGLKLNSLRLLKDDPVHSSATTGRAWLLYKYDAKVQNKASLLSEMLF